MKVDVKEIRKKSSKDKEITAEFVTGDNQEAIEKKKTPLRPLK